MVFFPKHIIHDEQTTKTLTIMTTTPTTTTEKMQEVARSNTGIKSTIAGWAKSTALQQWESIEYGTGASPPYTYMFAQLLLKQVHEKLGLDRAKALFVSAAPIDEKILRYFASIDLPIMEVFGQSECTGPHTVNNMDAFKLGTVGRPMIGTKTKIDEATGELCMYGRHIFAGYMDMDAKTHETIDTDGWLHSGDVAKIDNDHHPAIPHPSGFVRITGRIKELIITAGGENIPPVLIEEQMERAMPAISNCMVVGDKRKYLVLLICLHVEVSSDGKPTNKLTGSALRVGKELGSSAITTEDVRQDPAWKTYFDNGVTSANEKAASRAQRVAKWAVLPTDFSESGGELTPTLKLKRSVAQTIHQDVIEGLYGSTSD